MKKALCLLLVLISSIPLWGTAQNAASPQKSTDITGNELVRMLKGSTYDHDRALSYIGRIYGKNINHGNAPDSGMLDGFAEILENYLFTTDRKWDVPAEGLVTEALKDAPAMISAQEIIWKTAYKAAQVYFSEPTPKNAEKLFLALPEEGAFIYLAEGEARVIDLIFDYTAEGRSKNLSVLEKNIEAGEPHAVDVGFRLIHLTDGATAEILLYILGRFADNHPRLFLQKLLAHLGKPGSSLSWRLDNILLMITAWGEIPEAGNDPVKIKEIRNARFAFRIKALESVGDPDLKEIRDRCLSILKKKR